MPKDTAVQQEFLERIQAHPGLLHRLCRVYAATAEDREDLRQQMVLQLWRSYRSFDGRAAFSTWMYRVALNTALMHRRQQSRRPVTTSMDDLLPAHEPIDEHTEPDDVHHLHAAIRLLPGIDRALVVLRLEERSVKEIAEITGLTPDHVSVRTHRAIAKLRDLLGVRATAKETTT